MRGASNGYTLHLLARGSRGSHRALSFFFPAFFLFSLHLSFFLSTRVLQGAHLARKQTCWPRVLYRLHILYRWGRAGQSTRGGLRPFVLSPLNSKPQREGKLIVGRFSPLILPESRNLDSDWLSVPVTVAKCHVLSSSVSILGFFFVLVKVSQGCKNSLLPICANRHRWNFDFFFFTQSTVS